MKSTEEYIRELLQDEGALLNRFKSENRIKPIVDYIKEHGYHEGNINDDLLNAFHESFKTIYDKNYEKFLSLIDELIGAEHINADPKDPDIVVLLAGLKALREPIIDPEVYDKYIDKVKKLAMDTQGRVRTEARDLIQYVIEHGPNNRIQEIKTWASKYNMI